MEIDKPETLSLTDQITILHALQDYNCKLKGDKKTFLSPSLVELYAEKINKIESLINKIERIL
jgi:hypothetical protein